jgi:isopenicillin N synthase-like dioxygenase
MGAITQPPVHTIPVVDISPFLKSPSSDAADQVVRQMRHACHTYGFFYLVGHGVSEEVRRGHLDRAKLFFTLSEEEKMDVWIGKCMGKSHRGYEPSGIQTHKEGLKPDTKEVNRCPSMSLEDSGSSADFFPGLHYRP